MLQLGQDFRLPQDKFVILGTSRLLHSSRERCLVDTLYLASFFTMACLSAHPWWVSSWTAAREMTLNWQLPVKDICESKSFRMEAVSNMTPNGLETMAIAKHMPSIIYHTINSHCKYCCMHHISKQLRDTQVPCSLGHEFRAAPQVSPYCSRSLTRGWKLKGKLVLERGLGVIRQELVDDQRNTRALHGETQRKQQEPKS